jgi:hypothetical protein
MMRNGGQRRGSRRSSALVIVALLALFVAGCGSSSSDQAAQQEKVQQVKDQIGQIKRYIAHHRTSGHTRQRRDQVQAATRSDLSGARACLLKAGFRTPSRPGSFGVTHIGTDHFDVREVTLSTRTGIYKIGVAPGPAAARAWLRSWRDAASGTFYGGITSSAAAFAATPRPGTLLNGNKAYFAERRTVLPCAFELQAMSGPREVIGYWRHYP